MQQLKNKEDIIWKTITDIKTVGNNDYFICWNDFFWMESRKSIQYANIAIQDPPKLHQYEIGIGDPEIDKLIQKRNDKKFCVSKAWDKCIAMDRAVQLYPKEQKFKDLLAEAREQHKKLCEELRLILQELDNSSFHI